LNIILHAFYDMNGDEFMYFLISLVKCIQNDAKDDIMRDAK